MTTAEKRDLLAEQTALRQRQEHIKQDYERATERLDEINSALEEQVIKTNNLRHQVTEAEREYDQFLKRREIVQAEQTKLEAEDAQNKNRLKELETEIGQPKTVTSSEDTELLKYAEQLGEFSALDISYRLKITKAAATAALKAYIKDGRVKLTGRKVMGQPMYEHTAAMKAEKAAESEAWHAVRDFCVKQKELFGAGVIVLATGVEGPELDEALGYLLEKGVIEAEVVDETGVLYRYSPPKGMGTAAKKDAQVHKSLAKAETRAPGSTAGRGSAVGGTGRNNSQKLTIGDPDVRALVAAVERAGGVVDREGGSGHIGVRNPTFNDKRILISSTPSNRRSVMNDRSRIRRELGLKI